MSAKAKTAAPTGRNRLAQGNALGNTSQNTSSPDGVKEGGELPKGWRRVPIKDMAESIQYGHTASAIARKDGPRFLRITDIQEGRVDWKEVPSCDIPKEDIPKYRLCAGDLVFARTGATTGKSFLIGDCPEAVFASYLIRVRVSAGVDPSYLSAFFQSPDYWRQIEGGKRGIGQPNVNGKVLGDVQFPIAPLSEQRRIVAEIEKQFTRLEAGVAALRRVQANLKRYRAAVLKAACEGRLVPTEAELCKVPAASRRSPGDKQSRDGSATFETGEALLARILTERRQNWQGRGKYKEPAAPETASHPPLPVGWTWAIADQLSSQITDGEHIQPRYTEVGFPILSAKHVRSGHVVFTDVPLISERDFDFCLKRCAPRRDDILIVCVGATTGRAAIVGEADPFALVRSVLLIRTLISPRFLLSWIQSPECQTWIQRASGSSAQAHLYINSTKKMNVPLPPLAEQTRIVAEVERRLSVVEELEAVVSANLQRATRLRQSILQQAFSGKL